MLQRGSLRYLLEWVETALMCPQDVTIPTSSFLRILSQIDEAVNCDSKKLLSLDIDSLADRIMANEVAVLLMKVVRSRAARVGGDYFLRAHSTNARFFADRQTVQKLCQLVGEF